MKAHLTVETGQHYQIARISQVKDKRKDNRHYRLKLPNGAYITHKAFFPLLQILIMRNLSLTFLCGHCQNIMSTYGILK